MNNNIQESYCSFEVSKLLKEKGFNIYQSTQYSEGATTLYNYGIGQCRLFGDLYYRPTHALAVEWLRVNYDIEVYTKILPGTVSNYGTTRQWQWWINNYKDPLWYYGDTVSEFYNSPQEALDAGLLYTLNNLCDEHI